MSKIKWLLIAGIVIGAVAWFYREQSHLSSTQPGEENDSSAHLAASIPSASELVVKNSGAEPHFRLGFKFDSQEVGAASMLQQKLRFKFAMRGNNDGVATPDIVTPWIEADSTFQVDEISDSSTAKVSLGITKVYIPAVVEAEPEFQAQLTSQMDQLVDMKCRGTLDASDGMKEVECEFPNSSQEGPTDHLMQVVDTLSSLYIPLPQQPLGKGATWTQTVEGELPGGSSDLVQRIEVIDISERGATLDIKGRVELPPQTQTVQLDDGSIGEISLVRGEFSNSSRISFDWSTLRLLGSSNSGGIQELRFPMQGAVDGTASSMIEMHIDLEIAQE